MRALIAIVTVGLLGGALYYAATARSKPETPQAAASQVYKCKQADGTVLFSDAPCGEQGQLITIKETTVVDHSGLRERDRQHREQTIANKPTGPQVTVLNDRSTDDIGAEATPAEDDCEQAMATLQNSQNATPHQVSEARRTADKACGTISGQAIPSAADTLNKMFQ